MSVEIIHDYTTLPLPARKIKTVVDRIYRRERIPKRRETLLVFCSSRTIHRLNKTYRRVDSPTDVLSFSYDEPDLLGEIYVSLQRAKRQARLYGLGYTNELVRLTVHGMFHLLGYDHETAAERAAMERREGEYCGLSAP